MNIKFVVRALILATLGLAQTFAAFAQSTAFTYQGRLNDGAAPANGLYDLTFALQAAESGSAQVGVTRTNLATAVSNGLFTVSLDFGGAFPGAARWLEIGVRTNSGGNFVTLAPRQQLTATPYAITAGSATAYAGPVGAGQISGFLSPSNIGAGSITSTMLAAGSVTSNQLAIGSVTTSALANNAVGIEKLRTIPSTPLARTLTNPSPAVLDSFGRAVATVGSNTVLIGTYRKQIGTTFPGAAYLYRADGALLTTLTNPASGDFDFFGISVAALGTEKVLVGATAHDAGAYNVGVVYLFSTNGALLTTFTNPTPEPFDEFGNAIAAVGTDKVLIGAYRDSVGADNSGSAYLFGTNGTLLTTITNPTPAAHDWFGASVAAVGTDKVIIGAVLDDSKSMEGGAAYLFSTDGTLLATFHNPFDTNSSHFGSAVAAVGTDKILIGAEFARVDGFWAGAAYLFTTSGTLLCTFPNPNPVNNDHFGSSVATVGADRVLIGASGGFGGTNAGAAYLFSTNGTLLTTFSNPTPEVNDGFGYAVTEVGGNKVLIGAYGDSTGAPGAGSAYLFSLTGPPYVPGLISHGVVEAAVGTSGIARDAVTTDKISDGTITTNDLGTEVLNNTFWKLGGNTGASSKNGVFLGTTDDQPLELKVNGLRVLRLENNGDGSDIGSTLDGAPNLVGGSPVNFAAPDVVGATISGGGAMEYFGSSYTNAIFADYGTIGGGIGNRIAPNAAAAAIAGGSNNSIGTNSYDSAVGGGLFNHIAANSSYGTVAGGVNNSIGSSSPASTIGGGDRNVIREAATATIAGGSGNHVGVGSGSSFIGGGTSNDVADNSSGTTIAGGAFNSVRTNSAIGTIGGGYDNIINDNASGATISGGEANRVFGNYGTVAGGFRNTAINYAFAAGRRASAIHDGAFVWADSQNTDFASTAINQFNVRAGGGVRFMTGGGGMTVDGEPVFVGTDGASLVNLNASQLTGTLPVGAIGTSSIAPDAVTTDKVADGTISSADIADGTIVDADISAEADISDAKLATIATAGKVADSALSSNVARRNLPNTFTGDQTFAGSIGIGTNAPTTSLHVVGAVTATGFVGNGSGLTNVTAAVLQSTGVANLFKGETVSASGILTPSGNILHVKAGSWITAVSSSGFKPGTTLTLIFDGSATVLDNAGSLNLSGHFRADANDTLSLVFDGTNWYETSRSAN
jgi:hypothetical protein